MPGESCSALFTQSLAICHFSQPGQTGPCVLQNAFKKSNIIFGIRVYGTVVSQLGQTGPWVLQHASKRVAIFGI